MLLHKLLFLTLYFPTLCSRGFGLESFHLRQVSRLLEHRFHVHLDSKLQVGLLFQDQHLCDDVVGLRDEMLRLFDKIEMQQILSYDVVSDGKLGHHFIVVPLAVQFFALVSHLGKWLPLRNAEILFDAFLGLLGVVYASAVVLHFLLEDGAGQTSVGGLLSQIQLVLEAQRQLEVVESLLPHHILLMVESEVFMEVLS